MEIQSAIARWESEGGAIPQVQSSRRPASDRMKALTLRRVLVPIDFFAGVTEDAAVCKAVR
jgi:hypothetical protein